MAFTGCALRTGRRACGGVDASGAAINLVLLGMRGVAVNYLWMELDKQKDMKRWAEMQATTKSIVRLQPHYERVWDMNGWNLAYNTSAEWDAVPDRYYWVKEGAKLLKQGVERNLRATELYYRIGKIYQQKIGYADESVDYRKYFLSDPDPAFKGGLTGVNPTLRTISWRQRTSMSKRSAGRTPRSTSLTIACSFQRRPLPVRLRLITAEGRQIQ